MSELTLKNYNDEIAKVRAKLLDCTEENGDCKEHSEPNVTLPRLIHSRNELITKENKKLSSDISDDEKKSIKKEIEIAEKDIQQQEKKYEMQSKDLSKVPSGGKKSKTKKRRGNDWTRLVTKTFKDNKKKNKSYTFKQAILDAKKVYKKKGGESDNNQNNNNQNNNNNNGNNQEFNENNENNNNNQDGGKKSRKNRKNKTKKGGQENNQNQSE